MTTLPNSMAARDTASLVHPYTNLDQHPNKGPMIITRGEGVYVYDDAGKRYLEGMASLWCASLGFSEARLVQAATRQMEQLPTYHIFNGRGNEPSIELAETLLRIYEERDIVAVVQAVAPHFQARLRALADHPLVGEARGVGLLGALQIVADKATKAPLPPAEGIGASIGAFAHDHGLILRHAGGRLHVPTPDHQPGRGGRVVRRRAGRARPAPGGRMSEIRLQGLQLQP